MDRRIGTVGISIGMCLALAAPALAQDASPSAAAGGADGSPMPTDTWTTIISGLNAPRGIAFGADGTLYVGEQGTGGDQCMDTPQGKACLGATGAISAIKDGAATPVVSGLPSMAGGTEVGGVSDFVIADDGSFVVTVNLGGSPEVRQGIPEPFGAVVGTLSTAAADGTLTPIADLAQWEADNNPDASDPGATVDSNPYGVALAPDGSYLVADAGGNDLLMVGADGTVTLGAVFPASMQQAPVDPTASADPNASAPASPQMVPMQAVPTAVTIGPDGAAYVSQLTGFPFPVGGASIWRVAPGEQPTEYAKGLTNVMDLAFAPDGTLWVVEFAKDGLLSGSPTGALLSIPAGGGDPTLVASDGLMAPGGVAVDANGNVFVTNGSVMPGGGSVVMYNP